MKTIVTGAAGFLGAALIRRMGQVAYPGDIVLADREPPSDAPWDVQTLVGDIGDPAVLPRLLDGASHVIHLAAISGGAAEADYALSRAVNLDASLALLDHLAGAPSPVRLVYASSIAVFGAPLSDLIDDETVPRPAMTYGAHKLMVETALANLARLGKIEGLAPRLPGIVARPRQPNGFKSAFMSDIFHAMIAGEHYVMPVGPDATMWMLSARAAADALIHAALMPRPPKGTPCAFTVPALRLSAAALCAALASAIGTDAAGPRSVGIDYAPDAALEAQFGRLPPLETPIADALGFRHDGTIGHLVDTVLGEIRDAP